LCFNFLKTLITIKLYLLVNLFLIHDIYWNNSINLNLNGGTNSHNLYIIIYIIIYLFIYLFIYSFIIYYLFIIYLLFIYYLLFITYLFIYYLLIYLFYYLFLIIMVETITNKIIK